MVSTEEEVVGAVEEVVGEDLLTPVVVEVTLHLFEVAIAEAGDFMTVVGLGAAVPEEGMCFVRLSSVPANPLL